jgi:hypothetical protein
MEFVLQSKYKDTSLYSLSLIYIISWGKIPLVHDFHNTTWKHLINETHPGITHFIYKGVKSK